MRVAIDAVRPTSRERPARPVLMTSMRDGDQDAGLMLALPGLCADKPNRVDASTRVLDRGVRRSGGRKLGASSDAQTRLALYRQGQRHPRYGSPESADYPEAPIRMLQGRREKVMRPVAHTTTTGVHSGNWLLVGTSFRRFGFGSSSDDNAPASRPAAFGGRGGDHRGCVQRDRS